MLQRLTPSMLTTLLAASFFAVAPGCDTESSDASADAAATTDESGVACPECLTDEEQADAAERHSRIDLNAIADAVEQEAADAEATLDTSAEPVASSLNAVQIQLTPDPNISETIIGEKPNLDYTFTNQDGETINLAKDYAGKTLVITSIYTSCPLPNMCPRITSDFATLGASIPSSLRDDVRLILISFDPQRDTPEVLKAYGTSRAVDLEVTDLVVSDVETIKSLLLDELQVPIDVNPLTNEIMNHAMLVHVINPDGYIVVERTASTGESMKHLAEEVIRAATLPFSPDAPWSQIDDAETASPESTSTEG